MSIVLIPLAARAAVVVNPDAVAYQGDAAHDGSVTFQNFSATPVKLWSANLGGLVSYPLIAQGEVYVTANIPGGGYGVGLYALNANTGHVDWSVALNSIYWSDSAAYDNGKVFVFNNNFESSTMNAYNATTGALLWSTPLAGQYEFSSPPTASNGIVYTGGAGSGGTVYALSETNGATLWTAGVENGDNSSPTVTSNGVYVSYSGPQSYKFNPTTGALLWHFSANSEGGGGKTTVYYNGNIYVRGIYDSSLANQNVLLLSASTGQASTTFNDSSFSSPTAPAFANSRGYIKAGSGLLDEFDPSSGSVGWSRSSPDGTSDPFVTAPILINGDVFEGTGDGLLYEYDGVSGNLLDTINIGNGIDGPDEQNVSQPLTGLGAGDGLLVVPAGDTVNVYSVTVPEPGSLALLLAGASCVLGFAWRRRRGA
jgi:outer membrane protein assembly factor BamB